MIVDFTKGSMGYRLAHVQGRNELIAKAVGFKKGEPLQVFDTTGGLGKEAFLLAALGCQITLFERHPTVIQLLTQSLANAAANPETAAIAAQITFIPTCAIAYLQNAMGEAPDVIYCDPMFEARTKSAQVKKEMQFLQSVVGADEDGEQLVAHAWNIAKKRVVVKRAHLAPLLKAQPTYSLQARSHRFDIYCKY